MVAIQRRYHMEVVVVMYLDEDQGVELVGVFDADSESEQDCLDILKEDRRMRSDLEDAKDMPHAVELHPRLNFTIVTMGENVHEDLFP